MGAITTETHTVSIHSYIPTEYEELPDGALDVQELTVIWGLPPAKASVVLMRSVLAPIWDEDAVHRIVVGLFTSLNCACKITYNSICV